MLLPILGSSTSQFADATLRGSVLAEEPEVLAHADSKQTTPPQRIRALKGNFIMHDSVHLIFDW
ncbi:MAG TPA: hypothetical protein VIF60_21185 [Burkholderiaceae bacterium]